MNDNFYDGLPITTDEELDEYVEHLLADLDKAFKEAYAQIRQNAKDGAYDCW